MKWLKIAPKLWNTDGIFLKSTRWHLHCSCWQPFYQASKWLDIIVTVVWVCIKQSGNCVVMARYSHKGHDTIRYDPIRKCFTATKQATAHKRTTLEHRRSAYQHCRRCRCLNTGRPARRRSWATIGGGRCSLKSRVIQQGYCEYWPPNNSSFGDFPQLSPPLPLFGGRTARRFGGRTAEIFSDCAITKYFSRATTFTDNTSTHPGGRALLPISVNLPAPATLHETPFVDVADDIDGDGDWELCGISTSFEG